MNNEETNPNRLNEKIPLVFSNNVSVGTTLTELVITLAVGTTPHQLVYLSLPIAKHLGKLINDSIEDYERKMNSSIPTLDELFEHQYGSKHESVIEAKE